MKKAKSKKSKTSELVESRTKLSLALFLAAVSMIFSVLAIVTVKSNQPNTVDSGKIRMAAAAYYYVDCGATTNGNGTSASPWNNLGSVSNFVFSAGSKIIFKQGTVCTGQLVINSSGTGDAETSRVIFEGEGTGATIQGAATKPSGSGQNFIVAMDGKQYITIRNLTIKNAENPVLVSNSSYIVLDRLNVKDSIGYAGIYLISQNSGATYYNKISNCNISNITGSTASLVIDPGSKLAYSYGRGIFFYGNNVKYNEISGNIVTDNGDVGIGILFASDSTVRNNTVGNNGSAGIWVGGIGAESVNNLIEKNTVYNNCQKIDDEFGINLHKVGANNIVRYNKVYEQFYDLTTGAAGKTLCNTDGYDASGNCVSKYGSGGIRFDAAYNHMSYVGNKAYYNIIYNEYIGLSNINYSGLEFSNNVVYNSKSVGLSILGYNQESAMLVNDVFKNNIIHTATTNLLRVIGATISSGSFNNNIYYPDASGKFSYTSNISVAPTTYSFSGWKTAKGESASKAVDPLFTNAAGYDFSLKSNSPAKNAGASLGLTPDFAGVAVPQGSAPEIGAYEASETACVPNCTGKVCGDNGCGGFCGSCQSQKVCNSSGSGCFCTNDSCCNLYYSGSKYNATKKQCCKRCLFSTSYSCSCRTL